MPKQSPNTPCAAAQAIRQRTTTPRRPQRVGAEFWQALREEKLSYSQRAAAREAAYAQVRYELSWRGQLHGWLHSPASLPGQLRALARRLLGRG